MARMIQETSSHYRPSHVAAIFHSFPHLNVSLHLVNSTFAPESELYLEVGEPVILGYLLGNVHLANRFVKLI